MKGYLSKEIRFQISITRLKSSIQKYRLTIREQAALLKEKDREIAALKDKLINKEFERKELLS